MDCKNYNRLSQNAFKKNIMHSNCSKQNQQYSLGLLKFTNHTFKGQFISFLTYALGT